MKMTNWCVALLSASVFLAFCGCAYSRKCYKCAMSTEEECNRNQTLETCTNAQFHCATAKFTQVDNNGKFFSQTYMKKCLPLAFINNYCDTINGSGLVFNCSISSCALDYCNGPPPTTPTMVSATVTNTSPLEVSTSEPSSTQTEPAARSGSPSTHVFGLTMIVFVLSKILAIC